MTQKKVPESESHQKEFSYTLTRSELNQLRERNGVLV